MAEKESVSKIFSALSHPLRRDILLYLSEKGECSFTELMNVLKIDTGKLSFHLRNLEAFLEKATDGRYRLSRVGQNAAVLIKDLEAWAVEINVTARASLLPLANFKRRVLAFLIDLGIASGVFLGLPNILYPLTFEKVLLSVNIVFFLMLFWLYSTLLEGFAGQTIGKRVIGLKTVRVDGKRLFYDHAAVRNFGKIFLLPFDLIVGYKLNDRRFIRYFDKFAGTIVVDIKAPVSTGSTNSS
jgi:uncharacterized RDD family membrane protein YckC/DNA-binding HxlR family transcriptional regulator